MEPWEKVQRKLDDRLDKPDKTPQSRSPGYSQKMTMEKIVRRCIVKEHAENIRKASTIIKHKLREADFPYRLVPPVVVSLGMGFTFGPAKDFWSREQSREFLRTRAPVADFGEETVCRFNFGCRPSGGRYWDESQTSPVRMQPESVARVWCVTGDRRALVRCEMVALRRDQPYRTQYPDDWRWYCHTTRTEHAVVDWRDPARPGGRRIEDESEARNFIAQMRREANQAIKQEALKSNRRRGKLADSDAASDEGAESEEDPFGEPDEEVEAGNESGGDDVATQGEESDESDPEIELPDEEEEGSDRDRKRSEADLDEATEP